MARIDLKHLSLSYPVINVGASIRRVAISSMTGGLIQRGRDVSLVEAIRDITLTIRRDRVGLVGYNGAGKSTLLRTGGIYNHFGWSEYRRACWVAIRFRLWYRL